MNKIFTLITAFTFFSGLSFAQNCVAPPKPVLSTSVNYVCDQTKPIVLTVSGCDGVVNWYGQGNWVTTPSGTTASAYIYMNSYFTVTCTRDACTSSNSDTVMVDLAHAKITALDNIICSGGSLQLNTNAVPDTSVVAFQWSNSNGIIAGATNSIYIATSADTYNVEITYANGCVTGSSTFGGQNIKIENAININNSSISVVYDSLKGPAVKAWDKRFGSNQEDMLIDAIITRDKGFLLGGYNYNATISGEMTENSNGGDEFWIVKIDSSGNKKWDKSYGGYGFESLQKIININYKNFLLGGTSSTQAVSGDKSQPNKSIYSDFWIVKIDSVGNKIWDKVYGGDNAENLADVVKTPDNGFLLGGTTSSGNSYDVTEISRGGGDFWIIKIDSLGNKLWDKRFGGSYGDELKSIVPTSDGGFLLGGQSLSWMDGDKSTLSLGGYDFWLVKVDSIGNKLWDRSFGSSEHDYFVNLKATKDSGFVFVGQTNRYSANTIFTLFKLDAQGNKIWDKQYKGGYNLTDFVENESGFLLGGTTNTNDGLDVTQPSRGMVDYWLIQTDINGNKLWDRRFGGSNNDFLTKIIPIYEGFLLAGYSYSSTSWDKSQSSRRNTSDYWIIRTSIKKEVAAPYVISKGKKITLIASNCAVPVVWSGGVSSTGATITVLPIVTTTYTATCAAYGCTSASTVKVIIDKCGNIADLVVTTPITTGTSASPITSIVQNKITATNTIGGSSSNASARYVAGKSILLSPGFKVQPGSIFQAKVSPGCN